MVDMCISFNRNNSLGKGYQIGAFVDGQEYPNRYYYGYSKREAERKYRQEFGLEHRRVEKIDLTVSA